jgi:uncharacterized protein YlxW (UPF0749 family)
MVDLDAGVIIALVTAVAALVTAVSSRRKVESDATATITATVLSLLRPMQDRVTALEGEVATLRKRVADFRRGIRLLCTQVMDLGETPVWQPEDEDDADE